MASAENKANGTIAKINSGPQSEQFSQNELEIVWKKMVESEHALPRLANALSNCPPLIHEDFSIHFTVSNESQKSWIEKNCMTRLNSFLRSNLKNDSTKLVIDVAPFEPETEKKLYMPDEKAKFLLENNPELNELKRDLDLDIK